MPVQRDVYIAEETQKRDPQKRPTKETQKRDPEKRPTKEIQGADVWRVLVCQKKRIYSGRNLQKRHTFRNCGVACTFISKETYI